MKRELRAVRELLSDPKHWTQGVPALSSDNIRCDPWSLYAYAFCITGAVDKLFRKDRETKEQVINRLAKSLSPSDNPGSWSAIERLQNYNDFGGRSHSEILQLIDKAIEQS